MYDFLFNIDTGWFNTITGWLLFSLIPLGVLYVREAPGPSKLRRAYWMLYILVVGLMLVAATARNHIVDNNGIPVSQYVYQSPDTYDEITREQYPVDKIPSAENLQVWKAPDGTLAPYSLAVKLSKIHARANNLVGNWVFFHVFTVVGVLIALFIEETTVGVGIFAGSAVLYNLGKTVGGRVGDSMKLAGGMGMATIFLLFIFLVAASLLIVPLYGVYVFCTTYGKDFVDWVSNMKKYGGPIPPLLDQSVAVASTKSSDFLRHGDVS